MSSQSSLHFTNTVQSQLCVHVCILFPYLKHLPPALTFLECYKKNTVHYSSTDVPKPSLRLDTTPSPFPYCGEIEAQPAAHQHQRQQTWEQTSAPSLTNAATSSHHTLTCCGSGRQWGRIGTGSKRGEGDTGVCHQTHPTMSSCGATCICHGKGALRRQRAEPCPFHALLWSLLDYQVRQGRLQGLQQT